MTSSKSTGPRQVPEPQGGSPRPSHAYTRFIPREELSDFASWTPDVFQGTSRPLPISAASAEPAAAPAAPQVDEAEWLARIEQARQAGWQAGHRDGLEALEAAKRQIAQQMASQVSAIVREWQEQIECVEQQMAQAVLDTALQLARQVVRQELHQHPALVAQVAQDAIHAVMLSARHLRLRLHPEDMALVEAGAAETLKGRAVILQPDEGLARGGCIVESELGQVDARIEQRWALAAAAMGREETPLATLDPPVAELPS